MGNGGKTREQQQARQLRTEAWTLADIAHELGVAKSSVSRWVRDVDFEPQPRRRARKRGPNKLQRAKAAEIEQCRVDGLARISQLSDREFLMAGLGLYAGDGAKLGATVHFANSNAEMIAFFCAWFRQFFEVDESRLRVKLYLHDDLDLDEAEEFWSEVCAVPRTRFQKAYRAIADETRRHNRHVHGCCHVRYSSVHDLRKIRGMMDAMLLLPSPSVLPG